MTPKSEQKNQKMAHIPDVDVYRCAIAKSGTKDI